MGNIYTVDRLTGAPVTTTVPDNFGPDDTLLDAEHFPLWAVGQKIQTKNYGGCIIDITTLTGAPVIQLYGSVMGILTFPISGVNLNGNAVVATLANTGIYECKAAGVVSYTITGGTANVNLMLKTQDL